MSQVTFSKDLGILEAGSDYKGFLRRSNQTLDYFAAVSEMVVDQDNAHTNTSTDLPNPSPGLSI